MMTTLLVCSSPTTMVCSTIRKRIQLVLIQCLSPSGDFNNDKIFDLAVVNWDDNTISILLGNGNGTFKDQIKYSTGVKPVFTVTDDFNNDMKLDLAVSNAIDNSISVLLGNGDGTFQNQPNVFGR